MTTHEHKVPEGILRVAICLHYEDPAQDFLDFLEEDHSETVALTAMAERLGFASDLMRRLAALVTLHQDDVAIFVHEDHLVLEGAGKFGSEAVRTFVEREQAREPFTFQAGRCRVLFEQIDEMIPVRDLCDECFEKHNGERSPN